MADWACAFEADKTVTRPVHCENKPKAVSLNEFFSNEYDSRARILQNEPNVLL